jgi:hypothetical protein
MAMLECGPQISCSEVGMYHHVYPSTNPFIIDPRDGCLDDDAQSAVPPQAARQLKQRQDPA